MENLYTVKETAEKLLRQEAEETIKLQEHITKDVYDTIDEVEVTGTYQFTYVPAFSHGYGMVTTTATIEDYNVSLTLP